MYEPSKHYDTFFIAGFQYHDGALALGKLKPGKKLNLVPEPDNPYDPNAVALYRKGIMLGYVPKGQNALIAQLAHFGHDNVFECRVMQVNPQADPWEQVRVGIYVTDRREKRSAIAVATAAATDAATATTSDL